MNKDNFFASYNLANWIMNCLKPKDNDLIADLTCGHGAFINSAPNEINFYGCELDYNSYLVAKYLYLGAKLVNKDIREYFPKITFDYIVGNPPYGLEWRYHNSNYLSELYYCIKASQLLKPGGILAIIVPDSFCSDEFSDKSKIEELNSAFNYVVQISLDKNSFKYLGVENYKTKLLILQKKSIHIQDRDFKNEVLNISDAGLIYKEFIESLIEEKDGIKQKLFLDNIKNNDKEWEFKAKKLIFHIKANPNTKKYLADCLEYLNQYKNQKNLVL